MTYRHTFITSYKAKREAQYNEGFHFVPYPNDSLASWLKHDACAKKTTSHSGLRQTVRRLVDEALCMKQSVTQYTF